MTLYNTKTQMYMEHVNKKEIREQVKDNPISVIKLSPMKGLYCS